jgi:glycosyltransferase involved in cell wall biosynthesis
MRFCHVTTFYSPYHFGGDAILTQSMCEALARQGHDVTVVHSADAYNFRGPPIGTPVADPPNIHRRTLRSGFGPLLSLVAMQQLGRPVLLHRQLADALDDDFDVVHFHNISLMGGPGVLELSRAPVTLYTPHDHWLICNTHVLWKNNERPCDTRTCLRCAVRSGIPPQLWRLGSYTARQLEHVDAILPPSEFTAQQLRAAGITRPMTVIPSFTATRPAPTRPADGPFLYAGRLVRSKGIGQLLAAFDTRPDLRLRVVGDGPLLATLRQQYAHAAHIEFVGARAHDAMALEYANAQAVLVPSWGPEVFGLTVIEAMAAGAPVIVRRAGGCAESVERTGGGLVYDRPDELLPMIDRFLGDAHLRAALSVRANQGTTEFYSEQRWLRDYLRCIEAVRGGTAGVGS